MFSDRENIDFSPNVAPLRRTSWLICGTALTALLVLLGRNALVSTEGEFAESIRSFAAGRNLFAGGSFWYPDSGSSYFFGRLGGWLTHLTGNNEWTVRIFAVAAALLLLAGTVRLAEMCFSNRQVQVVSGWMLIGSYGFLYWGRHGSCFMLLAAVLLWWAILLMTPERGSGHIFALTALACGGAAVFGCCFLLPAAALTILFRRNSAPLSTRNRWIAVVIALLFTVTVLVLLGYVPGVPFAENLRQIGMVLWKNMVNSWRTMVYPGTGSTDWYRTPENLPRLLIPWLPVTVTVIAGMGSCWKEVPEKVRKLLFAVAAMFLLTCVFPGKRWQYALPLLPFMVVLTAGGLADECGNKNWNRIATLVMTWGCTLIAAVAVAVAVTYPLWNLLLKVTPPVELIVGLPLLGLLAIGVLVFDTGPTSAVARLSGMRGAWSGFILAAVILQIALWSVAVPSLTKFRPARPFWQKCHVELERFPRTAVLFFGDVPADSELYYLNCNEPVNVVLSPAELPRMLRETDNNMVAVIVRQHRSRELLQEMDKYGWKFAREVRESEPLRLLSSHSTGQKHYVMCEFVKK